MFNIDVKTLVDESAAKLPDALRPVLFDLTDKAMGDLKALLIGRKITVDGLIPGRKFTILIE